MEYVISEATMDDAFQLGRTLRKSDRLEVVASSGLLPVEALTRAFLLSPFWRFAVRSRYGSVIAMWGVGTEPNNPARGSPWMLASDLIDGSSLSLWKESKREVERMREKFEYLWNYVYAGNGEAVGFLVRLGFKVAENPVPRGVYGLPFYGFEMEGSRV